MRKYNRGSAGKFSKGHRERNIPMHRGSNDKVLFECHLNPHCKPLNLNRISSLR